MSESNTSALYAACQNGDFRYVEKLVHTLPVQEINRPEENGNTLIFMRRAPLIILKSSNSFLIIELCETY